MYGDPLNRWSFSRLKTGERCMYQLYLQKQKAERKQSEQTSRGVSIHKNIEDYILGKTDTLEQLNGTSIASIIDDARDDPSEKLVEQSWLFNRNWEPIDVEPWHEDVWLQVITDLCLLDERIKEIYIYDWKSGKRENNEISHSLQSQLYAIAALKKYPWAETVLVKFAYLDLDYTDLRTYHRGEEELLIPQWEERARVVTEATYFPPKPKKWSCHYCPYGIQTGSGVCEFAYE